MEGDLRRAVLCALNVHQMRKKRLESAGPRVLTPHQRQHRLPKWHHCQHEERQTCSTSSRSLPPKTISSPPFTPTRSDEKGKVSGCGMPPPRLIIPGSASNGCRARMALGCRALEPVSLENSSQPQPTDSGCCCLNTRNNATTLHCTQILARISAHKTATHAPRGRNRSQQDARCWCCLRASAA